MKRKFINALVFGALLIAPASTFVSCSDYDDDIASLQNQINQNADASNLSELVNQKLRNVDAEIESLNQVKEQLASALDKTEEEAARQRIAAAQALVDEAISSLTSARDDAQARIDEDKSLQAWLEANSLLQEGIDRANSCASKAYALAVQAEVDGVMADLEAIQTSLNRMDDLEGQIGELSDKINNAETGLIAQMAAINEAMQNKADKTELEALRTELQDALNKEVAGLRTELTGLMDQKVAAVKEELEKNYTDAISVATSALTTAYQEADQKLQDQITGLDGRVETLETTVSTLEGKVSTMEGLVDAMSSDLNNLVTGIILQDNQLQFVYSQVEGDYITMDSRLNGKEFTRTNTAGQTVVYFPYVNAVNAATLIAGHYNVEANGGLVYATVNPTRVDFTGKVDLKLENSLGNAPENIEVGEAVAAKNHLITTRAAGTAEDKAENGLYAIRLTNTATDRTDAPADFENSYALYTSFDLGSRVNEETGQTEAIERKVYSKYALNLEWQKAGNSYTPLIVAVAANGITPDNPLLNTSRYVVKEDGALTGNFQLTPQMDKNEQGINKPFRKYVEVVAVKDQRGTALSGAALSKAMSDVHSANKEALQKVFTESATDPQDVETQPNGFDQISITVPDAYNGYTFTLGYYVQNYDGTIVYDTEDVIFTKPLFSEEAIAFSHTPVSDAPQTAWCPSETFMGTQCMGAKNADWCKYTASISIESEVALQDVIFADDNKTTVVDVAMNGLLTGTSGATTETQLKKVKNLAIKYDPAKLEVGKTYTVNITFKDENGNVVSVLPVEFTMLYPTKDCVQILPNPAYFSPFDRDLKTLTTDYTYTAWAESPAGADWNTATETQYNIITGFNMPYYDAEGCALQFDLANKASYAAGGENVAYAPITSVPFRWQTQKGDYTFKVPVAAVKYGSEHRYPMQVAVNYFDVPTLWANPQEFILRYKSPIMYTDVVFDKAAYSVGYPEKELIITDANITADDPSTSVTDDVKYFGEKKAGGRDGRITAVTVELVDKQFASLFETPTVENDGIHIKTVEQTGGGTGAISAQGVTFRMTVADQFGNTRSFEFKVNVDPNEGQGARHK